MPTLLAKIADVLLTIDDSRCESKNAGLYAENGIDGKVVVKDGEFVTMDMRRVIETHNRCAARLAEG